MRLNTLPTRLSRGTFAALALTLILAAAPVGAQGALTTRVVTGVASPTGELKDWYAPGGLVGLQSSWALSEPFVLTGTTYWANAATHRRDGVPARAVAWTLDLGVEGRAKRFTRTGDRWMFEPFAGLGAGTRSYSLPTSVQGSTTGWGGYGALGADLLRKEGRLGLRTEVRAYRATFTDVQKSIPRSSGTEFVALVGLGVR